MLERKKQRKGRKATTYDHKKKTKYDVKRGDKKAENGTGNRKKKITEKRQIVTRNCDKKNTQKEKAKKADMTDKSRQKSCPRICD